MLVKDKLAGRGMPTDSCFEGFAKMLQIMGMIPGQLPGGRAEPPTGFGFPAIMGKAEPQIVLAGKPAANSSLFALADGSLERSESSASLEPPPQVDAPKSGDYQQAEQVQAAKRPGPQPSALSVLASTKGFLQLGKKKPKPLEDRGGNGDSGSEPEQDDGAADLKNTGKRGTPRKPAKSSKSTSAKKPTREVRAKPCNVKKQEKGKAKPSSHLNFPGINKTGHPIFYGSSTVYIDTVRKCWRLKEVPGQRHIPHFYFTKDDPKNVWKSVVARLRSVNRP